MPHDDNSQKPAADADPVHDEALCGCTDDSFCACPCKACNLYRARALEISRVEELENRLRKSGIDPEDFASMVWRRIELELQHRIEAIAIQEMALALKGLKLISAVQWSSIER